MTAFTLASTVTLNSAKTVHWGDEHGTICGAGAGKTRHLVEGQLATCKRCIKLMTLQVEIDHSAAQEENTSRQDEATVLACDIQPAQLWVRKEDGAEVEITRVSVHPFPRVSFRHTGGATGTLPLAWFLEAYGRVAHTQRAERDRLIEQAKALELPESTLLMDTEALRARVEVVADARRATARELDTWLTAGMVLVDPMLEEDLMLFERWCSQGGQLRNLRTGARHVVGQYYVTTWKYVPRSVDCHQVWRAKEGGALVRITDISGDGVQLLGTEEGDRLFWLSREQLAEYFTWEPGGGA